MASSRSEHTKEANCSKLQKIQILSKKISIFFFFFCVLKRYLETICKKKIARCVSPTLNSDFIEAQLKMQDELIFGFFEFFAILNNLLLLYAQRGY